MITRKPTPEERKLLDETETVVKNEIADVAKLVAADYIVYGPPKSTDTLNDIRERREKALAAFNAMAPQVLGALTQLEQEEQSNQGASTLAKIDTEHAGQSTSLPSDEFIDKMSLAEVEDLLLSLPKTGPLRVLVAIYRRSMDIAFHSHGTSDEDRRRAAMIAKATRHGMLNDGKNEPQPVLREAIEFTEARARDLGYGTLFWLLEEQPAEQTFSFAIRPEHAHLLKPFVAVLARKPDQLAQILPGLVSELIRARRTAKSDSSVMVLHGLACARDSVAAALFDDTEIGALRGAHHDYPKARDVLVRLGLLPERSTARGFQPQPPRWLLAEAVALAIREEYLTAKQHEPDLLAYTAGLDERWRSGFTTLLFHLCCHLALANIAGIYGEAARAALEADLPEQLSLAYDLGLGEAEKEALRARVKEVTIAERIVLERLPKGSDDVLKGVDDAIFYWMLYGRTPDYGPEFVDKHTDFARGSALLGRARIRFQRKLRFGLRCLSVGYALAGNGAALHAGKIRSLGLENRDHSFWEDVLE